MQTFAQTHQQIANKAKIMSAAWELIERASNMVVEAKTHKGIGMNQYWNMLAAASSLYTDAAGLFLQHGEPSLAQRCMNRAIEINEEG